MPARQVESGEMYADRSPFVSIIIPTYNGGQKLCETLACCLKIKKIDLEILLIDDASTDGTPDWIQQTFPTVILHRLSVNSGSGSRGRNVGLSLARGRYIKFLDHDDLLQPRGFKAECQEALRTDADLVMSRWGVASVDGRGRFRKSDQRLFVPPEPTRLLEAILLGESTPYTAAALYKRSVIADEQWDAKQAMIDDFDWFCRMAMKCKNVSRIDTISYYWRLHPGSTQGRSHRNATIYQDLMFARYRIYQKIEALLADHGELTPLQSQLLAKRLYESLRCFARFEPYQCPQLMAKIHALDPHFVVDATCEPEAWALWLIRRIGLRAFLRGYGALRRLGDAANPLRGLARRPSPSLHT
ncbi:MAG: glycosyltransferase family 2 protein [Cyanobacteriota bacterium]|nr:glycosyltransferase family 2 protein [Cyanobacteriota bacterium]